MLISFLALSVNAMPFDRFFRTERKGFLARCLPGETEGFELVELLIVELLNC